MERDTFTAGVVPGGLTDHRVIKILVCHVLDRVGALSYNDLLESLAGSGYANYFECTDAIAALVEAGHLKQTGDIYTVTPSGTEIAQILVEDVPLSVRDRVVENAEALALRSRNRNSHKVAIMETDSGYKVRCAVCDAAGNELFAMEMEAPTQRAAQAIRDNFVDRAEKVLRYVFTELIGEQF